MSQERRLELAARRGELTALIAAQREALGRNMQPVETMLHVGDRVVDGANWLKHHPGVVGVAVAVVVLAKPRVAWRWAKRGFILLRGWRVLRARLAH